MATIWKSTAQKNASNSSKNTISAIMLSSWSRQQKLAMIAGFAILGFLLVVSACSKQAPKSALVAAASSTQAQATPPITPPNSFTTAAAATKKAAKDQAKKRPANVSYSDATSGVSFFYPRRFALTSGDQVQPHLAEMGEVPMNFVRPGGVAVATVAMPGNSFPGTDFKSAFFSVNINRSVSEQECEHFAFVDTRNADGEPVDAEKINVGSAEMEMTSEFSASMMKQAETQYYHHYEDGACYEYVLGLGTEGYGAEDGIEPVNRDQVFSRLEKILTTVKVTGSTTTHPLDEEVSAEPLGPTIAREKE
jgi:hypothetical protein